MSQKPGEGESNVQDPSETSNPLGTGAEPPWVGAVGPEERFEAAIEAFLSRRSPNTARSYRAALRHLAKWAIEQDLAGPEAISATALHTYGQWLQRQKIQPRTRRHRQSVLRVWLHWLSAWIPMPAPDVVAAILPTTGNGESRPNLLQVGEVSELVSAAAREGTRELLAVNLMLLCGLGREEVVRARVGWCHRQHEEAEWWLCVEGDKRRWVPVPRNVRDLILRYLSETGRTLADESSPILLRQIDTSSHSEAEPLSAEWAYQLVKRLAKDAKLPRSATPHQLRQAYTCGMLAVGAPLSTVQGFVGHRSRATTGLYAEAVENSTMRDALERWADAIEGRRLEAINLARAWKEHEPARGN